MTFSYIYLQCWSQGKLKFNISHITLRWNTTLSIAWLEDILTQWPNDIQNPEITSKFKFPSLESRGNLFSLSKTVILFILCGTERDLPGRSNRPLLENVDSLQKYHAIWLATSPSSLANIFFPVAVWSVLNLLVTSLGLAFLPVSSPSIHSFFK